jgi:hypothetical protein
VKTIASPLQAHLQGELTTLATCWKITRRDGLVLGFTDCDVDLVVSGVTYSATNSYTRSNARTSASLAVDNLEVQGVLSSPNLTEDSLRAGLWDYAKFSVFYVNWANLSMGTISIRDGRFGEVSVQRDAFGVELLGLLKALTRTMGEFTGPGCRASLGDSRCTVNMAPFTFTFTVTGVNADRLTFYASALTQAGPTGGVSITGITNANPGHVSFASGALALVEGQPVILSGILGPASLNAVAQAHNPTSTGFDLSVDTTNTTNYPAYTGGGLVTPFGNSGYFEGGVVTWATGANTGFAMEVKANMPGQITLHLPMPYPMAIGDTGTIKAGCDKTRETCITRFTNIANYRGWPFLPGIDKLQQIGKK